MNHKINIFACLCGTIFLFLTGCSDEKKQYFIHKSHDVPQEIHGIKALKKELSTQGYVENNSTKSFKIILNLDKENDSPEAYSIRRNDTGLTITGSDRAGLMYGILDLKEKISFSRDLDEINETTREPNLPFRAIKFNLPWDSYRRSPALQMHKETCRDLAFWEKFLDMMAENRFNALTLWNLHPFSYMVKLDKFPEALSVKEENFSEWKDFWHSLFAMAKKRGIDTYIVNWNIMVSPEFAKAHQVAEYSIEHRFFGDGDTSDLVREYTKACVTEVINTYPNLTGIGVSLGERMGGMSPKEREEWIMETIVAGMQEAERPARFIHRAPFSADKRSDGSMDKTTEQITREAIENTDLPSPVWVEVKFNWSHGHSTPKLVKVHGGKLTDTYWNPMPENYKMAWTVRNEDIFCLRWGQTDFIREHIKLNVKPYVGGYFIGSECYIPADDYFTRSDNKEWDYAFERQWLFYKTWGRLLYNPKTKDQVFINEFQKRYGKKGENLFEAFSLVSRVPLEIASMRDVRWDFTLYSEGFLARGRGEAVFISIDNLINTKPLDPDYLNIKDYVDKQVSGANLSGFTTPLKLAEGISEDCKKALELIDNNEITEIIENKADKENSSQYQNIKSSPIYYEYADVKIWANLGLYYASKIMGGIALQNYRLAGDENHKNEAINHLTEAASYWEKVITYSEPAYKEMPLVHLINNDDEYFHWSKYRDEVQRDIETARNAEKTN